MKKLVTLILSITMASSILFTGCAGSKSKTSSTATDTFKGQVKIGVSSWIGFAPLFVAEQKGFFKKEGVNVKLEMIQSATDRRTALAANKIQGFTSTVDTHVMTAAANVPVTQIVALDTSYGGDGIVAKKEIKSLKDLKGKRVAIDTAGGASYFWFQYLLDKQGMKLSDVQAVNMSAGDAGAAFVGGKVDAAVTWQPWLTKAEQTSFGHVLVSSKETPGLIVDSLAMREDFVKNNPKLNKAIVKAWYDALDYAEKNPDDADAIMAKSMGQTTDDFKQQLPDVKFYGKADNVKYFGTSSKHGLIWDVTEKASSFWLKCKLIDKKPDAKKLIDGSFVNQ